MIGDVRGKKGARFAVCVNNAGYPVSLELHEIYRVLPDEFAEANCDLRIVDESGEDHLHPAGHFVLIELPQAETDLRIVESGQEANE